MMGGEMGSDMGDGRAIVRADLVGTAVFTVSAVLAAAVFDDSFRLQGVVVSLVLFALGIVAFAWSYWLAVQRSRTDEIAVSQLYLLMGPAVPAGVRNRMNGALAVQTVVALATAIARPSTDGQAGSTLAFGVLVPMFGLGMNGLWAARHGHFEPRRRPDTTPAAPDPVGGVPPPEPEMEQNAPHG
jgi:hypothetical protein